MQHTTIYYDTPASLPASEITATHCNTLRHMATHCNTRAALPASTNHCTILQYTATHCNTLQHTAMHRNTLQHTCSPAPLSKSNGSRVRRLLCAHCITLQHTATHCITLKHSATHCNNKQTALAQRAYYVPFFSDAHPVTHMNECVYCPT